MKNQYLKTKILVTLLFTLLIITCLGVLTACKKDEPNNSWPTYTAVYSADSNGSIVGETNQHIGKWRDASGVTAVPNEGYVFAGWSDGSWFPTRRDERVDSNIDACAMFISKTKTLKYEYNGATSNNTVATVTFDYDNVTSSTFVIPSKTNHEFQGWYLDKEFTRRVTDKDGVYYLGKSILFSDADTLYARWETREGIVYPVLMLFIGDIDARFKDDKTDYLYFIKHEIAPSEIKICEEIAPALSSTLNEWFDGKVYFEFDSFYTTSIIDARSYSDLYASPPTSNIGYTSAVVQAPSVLEVAPILKNYRSVLTTAYHTAVSESTGIADHMSRNAERGGRKYANLSLEYSYIGVDLSKPLNLENCDLEITIDEYLHEFIHTIEQGIGLKDYHEYSAYFSEDHREMKDLLTEDKLYLLNQAELNGKITGIPFAYWEGDIDVYYIYSAQRYYDMGEIKQIDEDKTLQGMNIYGNVPYGSSVTVEAIPNEGYKFVGWSDGVTTPIRTDEITSYLIVGAIFEKI